MRQGGLVVFPSDTVYGLAVDPTNPEAVKKLLRIKSRQIDKAVSVLVADQAMAEKYVVLSLAAKNFYQNFLPGPFTVISKIKTPSWIDPRIYAANKTLGVRIPDYPFLIKLTRYFDRPFTATSANISGKKPHYTVEGFLKTLSAKRKGLIDLVIDAGKLPYRKPSTVVDFSEGEIKQLRAGDLVFGKEKKYQTKSPKETKKLAGRIIRQYYQKNRPLVLALVGDLGSGKTTFCQGIGEYYDIKKINSPTFNITKEYPIPDGTFYHIDTYRLEKGQELIDLGFEKMLKKGNLIAIEWAEKIKNNLCRLKNKNNKTIWLFIVQKALAEREIKILT